MEEHVVSNLIHKCFVEEILIDEHNVITNDHHLVRPIKAHKPMNEQEVKEKVVISQSDTAVDPRTMMIELGDTAFAQ